MKYAPILAGMCASFVSFALPKLAAAQVPVSCATLVSAAFNDPAVTSLRTIATRVTARGTSAFATFSMSSTYDMATSPLGTPATGAKSTFVAFRRTDASAFSGGFHEVFPSTTAPGQDTDEFWAGSDGRFWIKLVTYGGAWTQFPNTVCYRGPSDQIVVTSVGTSAAWGTDVWSFVLVPNRIM